MEKSNPNQYQESLDILWQEYLYDMTEILTMEIQTITGDYRILIDEQTTATKEIIDIVLWHMDGYNVVSEERAKAIHPKLNKDLLEQAYENFKNKTKERYCNYGLRKEFK